MALISAVDAAADDTNLGGVGEIRLIPDLSTKWRIPWYFSFIHKEYGLPFHLHLRKTFLTSLSLSFFFFFNFNLQNVLCISRLISRQAMYSK